MSLVASEETRLPPVQRRLRLGFVGGGRGALIGRVHAMGARLSNRWQAVAGALSSDPQVALESGRDWLLADDRIYSDYRDMAEKEAARQDGIEAVVISTPNWTHKDIAEAFLRRGIDVICDKPLTTTLDDALELVKLQRETGLVVGVTYPYPSHAMVRQARELVLSGELGRVRQVHVEYMQDWATEPDDPNFKGASWRRDPGRVGRASATNDIGTHAFHLAHFVTGLEMVECRAEFHVCGAPKAMEDTAFVQTRYEGGVPGTLWVTQAAPGNYCALRIRVYGEKAGLEWDQEKPEFLRFNRLNRPETVFVRGHGAGMVPQAERLLSLPRGHPEALSDAWANLYSEFAIAIEARRAGKSVPEGLLNYPTVLDEAGSVWRDCRLVA